MERFHACPDARDVGHGKVGAVDEVQVNIVDAELRAHQHGMSPVQKREQNECVHM